MRVNYKFFFLFVFVVLVVRDNLCAQSISTPYSIYGIGDIDSKTYGRTSGMAVTGIALSSSTHIINSNPASLTSLEQSFFNASVSTAAKFVTYKGESITAGNSTNNDFWIKGFSLATKINKFWATNVGFGQFSNVSYLVSGYRRVEGSTREYFAGYQGDGGLNEYYWSNGISIGKHFSVGVKSAVIAGPVNQTETIYDDALQSTITTTQRDYYGNLRFQYGALYKTSLGKNWDLSIGGRYSTRNKLSSQREITVLQDTSTLVKDRFITENRFWLPQSYAAGIALRHNKKTTFTVDYTQENWADLKVRGTGWKYVDNKRLAAGVEFSNFFKQLKLPVQKNLFQVGAFYNNSYLQVNGKQINAMGVTAGLGGWLSGNLQYNIAGEYGTRGRTDNGLIRENYLQFTFSVSYRDFLLSKGRRYN